MDFSNKPVEEIKERLKRELTLVDPASNRALQIRSELDGFDPNNMIFKPDGSLRQQRGAG